MFYRNFIIEDTIKKKFSLIKNSENLSSEKIIEICMKKIPGCINMQIWTKISPNKNINEYKFYDEIYTEFQSKIPQKSVMKTNSKFFPIMIFQIRYQIKFELEIPEDGAIELKILHINGNFFKITVGKKATIASLKNNIAYYSGIEPSNQILFFNSNSLEIFGNDFLSIQDIKIKNGDTIVMATNITPIFQHSFLSASLSEDDFNKIDSQLKF